MTRSRRSPLLLVGVALLAVFALLAVLAPWLTPYSPTDVDPTHAFRAPSWQHWFGTDELGRDLLTRTLYGARISLATCVLAAGAAGLVGVTLGLLTGYFGRWTDTVIMRAIDVQLAVPAILLAMVLIVVLGRGFTNTTIAIAIAEVPAFARIVRASTLAAKEQEYVHATTSMGAGHLYTMFRTIGPNIMGPVRVQLVITGAIAVLLEAALSFLGLGIQPPTPSWGDMLRNGKGFLDNAPYYAILPGIMLSLTVLSLEFIGRGLRQTSGARIPAAVEAESRS